MKNTSRRRLALLCLICGLFAFSNVVLETTQAAPRRVRRPSRPMMQAPRTVTPSKAESTEAESVEAKSAEPLNPTQPVRANTVRQPARQQKPSKTESISVSISPEAAREELAKLCEQVKTDAKQPTPNDLFLAKDDLLQESRTLKRVFDTDPNREAAEYWRNVFDLSVLIETLRIEDPDMEILQNAWAAFNSDHRGIKWTTFDGVRKALRRYMTLRAGMTDDNYQKQLVNVCDNLSKYIEEYSRNADPGYGTALADVSNWLEDVSTVEARTQRMAALIRRALSAVNISVQVSSKFVAAGFNTAVDESFDVNDNILGTRVVGSGTITGTSTAQLENSVGSAIIKVLVDTSLKTSTTGYHSPVTLRNDTTGTIAGEKSIRFAADSITTTPARSSAKLNANIHSIRINGGPLVQSVARGRINEQRGPSLAVASRNAERRINQRIDGRIDERITELNQNYHKKFREPLENTGLFPEVWNISSATEKIDWSALVGSSSQPGAPALRSVADSGTAKHDLFVQVHQSSLNNAAAIAFSGRDFDEEKAVADLEKQFKKLPKALQREEGQSPICVTFAAKTPIAVSFVDGKIKAVFHIDAFVQEGTKYPGLDVTLLYDVKTVTEKGDDGKEKVTVIFEQAEAPQAFPRNFDPKSGQRISARHQAIRTIVTKRLETSLPKRFEGKPQDLPGEWAGAGKLVPVFAESQDGWLTLAWNWEEN